AKYRRPNTWNGTGRLSFPTAILRCFANGHRHSIVDNTAAASTNTLLPTVNFRVIRSPIIPLIHWLQFDSRLHNSVRLTQYHRKSCYHLLYPKTRTVDNLWQDLEDFAPKEYHKTVLGISQYAVNAQVEPHKASRDESLLRTLFETIRF